MPPFVQLRTRVIGAALTACLVVLGGVVSVDAARAATTLVATGNVNLRSGPGTSNPILITVPVGASVSATGSTSGSWTQVTYSGKTGYVYGTYLTSPTATAPTTSTASGTATTTGAVNVRTGPGTNYSIVGVAAAGTAVSTTGVTSGSWTQVGWGGATRWMYTSYLKQGTSSGSTTTTPTTVGQVRATANVYLRTAGNQSAPIYGTLAANSLVDVTGQTTSAYTQVVYAGRLLWIYTAYTAPVTASPLVSTQTASARVQSVIKYAASKLGDSYVWGAAGPDSFDCSGLTLMAYSQVGVSLPHKASYQATMGTAVSRANLAPGDLIFWYSPVQHVSLYIGNGQMIHARGTAYGVVQQSVDAYITAGGQYVGARRFIS